MTPSGRAAHMLIIFPKGQSAFLEHNEAIRLARDLISSQMAGPPRLITSIPGDLLLICVRPVSGCSLVQLKSSPVSLQAGDVILHTRFWPTEMAGNGFMNHSDLQRLQDVKVRSWTTALRRKVPTVSDSANGRRQSADSVPTVAKGSRQRPSLEPVWSHPSVVGLGVIARTARPTD